MPVQSMHVQPINGQNSRGSARKRVNATPSSIRIFNKLSPLERRDDMPPRRWQFDPKIAADLRPSADESAVGTPLVAGGG